ncbi:MAG: flagellar export chaperone FliS [Burkholderiaceae bacterium]
MFGSARNGASAYAKVGIETGVAAASPHKLIVMLFDGALLSVATAAQKIKDGDVAGKGAAISKAIAIIDSGLRASLNKEAGGEIALSLDALYEYMGRRLLAANLENRLEVLDEVHGLLADLKSAWEAIGDGARQPVPDAIPATPRATGYDPLAPRLSNLVRA